MSFAHPRIPHKSGSSSPVKLLAVIEGSTSLTYLITDDMTRKYGQMKKHKSFVHLVFHVAGQSYGQHDSNPCLSSNVKLGHPVDDPLLLASDIFFVHYEDISAPIPASSQKLGHKKACQWAWWRDDVIPSLIDHYLSYLASHQQPSHPTKHSCSCGNSRELSILVLYFDSMCSLHWILLSNLFALQRSRMSNYLYANAALHQLSLLPWISSLLPLCFPLLQFPFLYWSSTENVFFNFPLMLLDGVLQWRLSWKQGPMHLHQ